MAVIRTLTRASVDRGGDRVCTVCRQASPSLETMQRAHEAAGS